MTTGTVLEAGKRRCKFGRSMTTKRCLKSKRRSPLKKRSSKKTSKRMSKKRSMKRTSPFRMSASDRDLAMMRRTPIVMSPAKMEYGYESDY
jgi:hypothetical protein